MKKNPTNVMSVDLEEWFQVTNFASVIPRSSWERCVCRVHDIMPRLLDLFAAHHVRATFFVLGWIAEHFPGIVSSIARHGHEVASHGYDHSLVTGMHYREFRKQLRESKDILEQIIGRPVVGYRAPSYSLRNDTTWVIDELLNAGFMFDSSIFPFGARSCPGICSSRVPCVVSRGSRGITEYPLSIVNLFGIRAPIAGGGYFRLLPYQVVSHGVRKLNARGTPAIMFFHPWEFDPSQPRVVKASCLARFRHYLNLGRNEEKFKRLIREFRFGSIRDVFWNAKKEMYDTAPQI